MHEKYTDQLPLLQAKMGLIRSNDKVPNMTYLGKDLYDIKK